MTFSAFKWSRYNMHMLAMQYYYCIWFLHVVQLNGFESHVRSYGNESQSIYLITN